MSCYRRCNGINNMLHNAEVLIIWLLKAHKPFKHVNQGPQSTNKSHLGLALGWIYGITRSDVLTVDWYTTDSWPIYHRHMTDSKSRCVVEISTDTRPIVYLTIDRLSTDYRPTIDRLSTDHRPTIDRLSTDYRPTIDQLSTDCRPLYRPISTVNKIRVFQYQTHGKMFVRWNMLFTWKSNIGVLIED